MTTSLATRWSLALAAVLAVGLAGPARAADFGPSSEEYKAVLDKAVAYLKSKQGADGSFAPKVAGPGVSALVAAGLLRNGLNPDDPLVAKTLAYLQTSIKKD